MAPIGRVRGSGFSTRAMPKGGDVHVPLARAVDPLGNPALRTARSRKVQKGEDASFETPDAFWVARRRDGRRVAGEREEIADGDVVVRFSAFGLFDGHGGKACAEHCASTMLDRIKDALDESGPIGENDDADDAFEARLPAALRDAFAACDAEFLAKDVHSGATATVVVVHGRCVTTASVGDSLAVVDLGVSCGFAAPAARLSPEHRLDTSAAERERIAAFGGEVRATAFEDGRPVGPLRVWPGGLAVSRSIGDRDGKKGGVVSEPEVSRVVVPDEQPGFRITLASDGLWDAVTVKQAAQCSGRLATAAAAAALCKQAQKQKDNRDDITVVVVDALADPAHKDPFILKPPWKVAFKVKWPLRGAPGKEPLADDPELPPPSARARWRLEAGEREAAAAAAAAAEARERAEAAEAARRADARAEEATRREIVTAAGETRDDGGGWEEVPSSHETRGARSTGATPLASPEKKKKKKHAPEKTRAGTENDGSGSADGAKKSRDEKERRARESRPDPPKPRGGANAAASGVGVARASPAAAAAVAAAAVAAADMRNLSVSGAAAPPPPRASADQAPATPAKKERRKGKRERAAERAAAEAAAAAAAAGPFGGPDVPVASVVSGGAAALAAARAAEPRRARTETPRGLAPPSLGSEPFRGQFHAHPGFADPAGGAGQQTQTQHAAFPQGPHPGWPPGVAPPLFHQPPGANAHRPFPVGSAAGNAPAEARASPRTSGPASARPVDADAALKPKPKRKGKRERAQERARREAEAANA